MDGLLCLGIFLIIWPWINTALNTLVGSIEDINFYNFWDWISFSDARARRRYLYPLLLFIIIFQFTNHHVLNLNESKIKLNSRALTNTLIFFACAIILSTSCIVLVRYSYIIFETGRSYYSLTYKLLIVVTQFIVLKISVTNLKNLITNKGSG